MANTAWDDQPLCTVDELASASRPFEQVEGIDWPSFALSKIKEYKDALKTAILVALAGSVPPVSDWQAMACDNILNPSVLKRPARFGALWYIYRDLVDARVRIYAEVPPNTIAMMNEYKALCADALADALKLLEIDWNTDTVLQQSEQPAATESWFVMG